MIEFDTITLNNLGKVRMCKRVLKEQTSDIEEIPFYKISTFGGKADTYISKELFELYKSKYSYPKKGDILISAAGTVGKTVIFDGTPSFFQDSNIVWIDNNENLVSNGFLYYFFQTNPWQTTNGSTIKRIYNDDLKNIKITFPKSILLQQKIAKVLSDLDSKIELNNKINAELEAMAKNLYDYWFVQFDFPAPSTNSGQAGKPYNSSGGKMVWNKELKRKIPEGWEVKELNKLLIKFTNSTVSIESKNILSKGKHPVITQENGELISGFTDEESPIEDIPVIVFGDHSCTLRYIDFPFFRGADGTQIMRFSENMTIYIFLFLKSVISQIPAYGKYERHYKYLKEFKVVVPTPERLKEFQNLIYPIFYKISKLRLENQHLASLRDWLLPMLMNGQVTVGEVEEKLGMVAEEKESYKNN